MEKCSIIYNPISTGFNLKLLGSINDKFKSKGFKPKLIESKFSGHVQRIIKRENKNTDLIVTLGGDGTIGEAIQGFQACGQSALYSHISTGTANDVCNNFGLNNDPLASTELILDGNEQTMDFVTVNDVAFGYVSCFGALTNIPYETNHTLKKLLRKNGYIVSAIPEVINLLRKKIQTYNITYNRNGETITSECILGAISNSKGFGGALIYPDADIDDGLFEVALIKKIDEQLILRLINDYLNNNVRLENYEEYLDIFQTDSLDICFNGKTPIKPIDNDGDMIELDLNKDNDSLSYRTGGKVKMLLPKNKI